MLININHSFALLMNVIVVLRDLSRRCDQVENTMFAQVSFYVCAMFTRLLQTISKAALKYRSIVIIFFFFLFSWKHQSGRRTDTLSIGHTVYRRDRRSPLFALPTEREKRRRTRVVESLVVIYLVYTTYIRHEWHLFCQVE